LNFPTSLYATGLINYVLLNGAGHYNKWKNKYDYDSIQLSTVLGGILMSRDKLINVLEDRKMTEIIELIEDAEKGQLEQLELAPSLGLLRDEELNEQVINYLKSEGVEIIYVNEED
jgi:hypothetical protein